MLAVVLTLHLLVCICLIGLVLLQRSEGGALGVGGGGGGALMSGRGAADALARMTSFAGAFFLATSLGLTVISGAAQSSEGRSIFDLLPQAAPVEPGPVERAPDPLESSVPDLADTQLASASEPITLAPAPAGASTRAGPVTAAAPPPAAQVQQASANTQQPRPPANQVRNDRPPAQNTSSQRPANSAAAQPAVAPASAEPRAPALVIPNTSGSSLAPDNGPATPLTGESGEAGVPEPIRRERAGPDQ